jgi:hypothetical protein
MEQLNITTSKLIFKKLTGNDYTNQDVDININLLKYSYKVLLSYLTLKDLSWCFGTPLHRSKNDILDEIIYNENKTAFELIQELDIHVIDIILPKRKPTIDLISQDKYDMVMEQLYYIMLSVLTKRELLAIFDELKITGKVFTEEEMMKLIVKNFIEINNKKIDNKKELQEIREKEKTKRESIPSALRRAVWNEYIGETKGESMCFCCGLTNITQQNFQCGHIIADADGGKAVVENLRPICVGCNSSMGKKNMKEFIIECGFTKSLFYKCPNCEKREKQIENLKNEIAELNKLFISITSIIKNINDIIDEKKL